MSNIQNFKNEWLDKLNTKLIQNQEKIDLYLLSRQTAVILTDSVGASGSFSLPALKVLNIKDNFNLPALNATKLGDVFDWSYPITGPENFSKDFVNYRNRIDVVKDYENSSDINLKNISIQYKSLISSNSINNILKSSSIGFQYVDSLKKLRDAGVDTWFDNWIRSVYSTITGSRIKVSNLKETDYNQLFINFENNFNKYYKGYYDNGTRLTSPSNLLYLATIEAGDNYFDSLQSTSISPQIESNDWSISVLNPSDNTKKIQGVINFTTSQSNITAIATINNLPVSYTNPVTGKVNINEIGSLTSKIGPESSTNESLANRLIGNLESLIKNEYGITLKLKYNKSNDVSQPDQSLVDLPVASTASQVLATQSNNELALKEFIFNVEIQDTFTNSDLGSLVIIKVEDETLIYGSDESLENLSPEYTESGFEGQDETMFEATEEEVQLQFDMADARINGPSDTSGNYEPSARIVPSKLNKSMSFIEVTEAVISNLEGGYFHPDMTKDGRVKDSRYSTSGETMFGLDRKQGDNSSSAAINFWSEIDKAGARSKWRWNHMPKDPLYSKLVQYAAGVIEPMFNRSLSKFCPDKNIQNLIKSDGRLMFNVIYAQWNGVGWIKGLLGVIIEEYNNGNKTSDSLLKASVIERVKGGHRMYRIGTGKTLGSRSASLISQGGRKIAKITGVQIT
jgi:hypothetical protein